MKKLLTTALAVMATLSIYAQGEIEFKNQVAGGAKIMLEATTGAALVAAPYASQAYKVALFWAPAGTTDTAQFQQLGNAAFLARDGYVSDGVRTIPAPFVGGGNASFLVKAWEVAYGTSYDAVVNSGNTSAHAGMSAIWTGKTSDPTITPKPTAPPIGGAGAAFFPGLTMSPVGVPEPSTIALGLLGLAGLFVLRRRS